MRGPYVGRQEDHMWSFHSVLQSCQPQQKFCFLQTAARHQPTRRFWKQPGGQTDKHKITVPGPLSFIRWIDMGRNSAKTIFIHLCVLYGLFLIHLWWEWVRSRSRSEMMWEHIEHIENLWKMFSTPEVQGTVLDTWLHFLSMCRVKTLFKWKQGVNLQLNNAVGHSLNEVLQSGRGAMLLCGWEMPVWKFIRH